MVKLGGQPWPPATKAMKLLTIKEVCSRLAISRSKLYELFRSGQLSAVRIGKRGVRVSDVEITRFIESASYYARE
jgi:excisionase family DNA binding protein